MGSFHFEPSARGPPCNDVYTPRKLKISRPEIGYHVSQKGRWIIIFQVAFALSFQGCIWLHLVHERWECCVCVFLFWVDTWFDDDESGQISSTRPKKTQMVVFWKGNSPCFSGKLDGW